MIGRRGAAAALAAVVAGAGAAVATAPWQARGGAEDPLVVSVSMEGATGAGAVATGFAVAPARVVTVAHVVDPGRRVVVHVPGAAAQSARVLRINRRDDVALIAVPGLTAPALRTNGSDKDARLLVRRGGRIASIPAQVRRRVTATLRGPGSGPYVRPALELRARVGLGDSGAPVVDATGALAGMLFARSDDRATTGWALDARAVAALLRRADLDSGRR